MTTLRTSFAVAALALLTGCLATPHHRPDDHPLAWLEGHWVGHGLGGEVEEVWLPERGGAMTCVFRMLEGDVVKLYELVTIQRVTTGEGFEMRLKHFHPNLDGWEAREECNVWPLTALGERSATFGPVTYRAIGREELRASVRISTGDGRETAHITMRRLR